MCRGRGRSVESRVVRKELTQLPYCHAGPDVWVWSADKGPDLVHDPDEAREERDVQSWPCPSLTEALRRADLAPFLGNIIEVTQFSGA